MYKYSCFNNIKALDNKFAWDSTPLATALGIYGNRERPILTPLS